MLRVEHISKRFGAVTALRDINLHLEQGEVLGLLGDNGAGKSTLLKILCGFQQPDGGRILVNGQEVTLKSVDHARSLGIDVVYQDLALVNQLSVYHNMFLNRERIRWPFLLQLQRCAGSPASTWTSWASTSRRWTVDVAKLSGGQRQAIAVARVGVHRRQDPAAGRAAGRHGRQGSRHDPGPGARPEAAGDVSVIIIAHNYGQVLEICDRVNLLQHGEITFDKPSKDTSLQELNDIVVEEYRRALAERHKLRLSVRSTPPGAAR